MIIFCIFLFYVATLEIEHGSWPTESKLNLCIGWYIKCTRKFDYFPIHILLLRLVFTFGLPIASCNKAESQLIIVMLCERMKSAGS